MPFETEGALISQCLNKKSTVFTPTQQCSPCTEIHIWALKWKNESGQEVLLKKLLLIS